MRHDRAQEEFKFAMWHDRAQEEFMRNDPQPLWLKKVFGQKDVAIIGSTGVGKSTLINTLRGVRRSDEDFAPVGVSDERTLRPDMYRLTDCVRLWELPAAGTDRFPMESYIQQMGIKHFDCVLVALTARFLEVDARLFADLEKHSVPYAVVRTRVDCDVYNDDHGMDEESILKQIRESLKKHGVQHPYLVCRNAAKYDMPSLKANLSVSSDEAVRNALGKKEEAKKAAEEKTAAEAAEKAAAEKKYVEEKAAAEKKASEEKAAAEKAAAEKKAAEKAAAEKKEAEQKKVAEKAAEDDSVQTMADEDASGQQKAAEAIQAKQPITHMIFGNPGLGKTTWLNIIAGEVLFESGPSKDTLSITRDCEFKEHNGDIYVNLPGLSDPKFRKECASHLTKALKRGGRCKVIFIVGESSGRIVEEDKVTIKLVLDAAPMIGVSYGLIVNKCGIFVMTSQEDEDYRKLFLNNMLKGLPFQSCRILFNPEVEELKDKKNGVIKLPSRFSAFLKCLPIADLRPDEAGEVDGESFEDKRLKLQTAPDLAQKAWEAIQKLDQEHRDQVAQRMAEARSNVWKGLVVGMLMMCATTPGLMTILCIRGFDKIQKAMTIGGSTVQIQWVLLPYCLLFGMYKGYAVIQRCFGIVRQEKYDFEIYGRSFRVPGMSTNIKVWHVYVAMQGIDAVMDASSLRTLLVNPKSELLMRVSWSITTFISCLLPLLYLKGFIDFARILLYELAFEDTWQSGLGIVELHLTRKDIKMVMLFSCVFSILSIVEEVAQVARRLRSDQPPLEDYEPLQGVEPSKLLQPSMSIKAELTIQPMRQPLLNKEGIGDPETGWRSSNLV